MSDHATTFAAEPLTREALTAEMTAGWAPTFLFFWGHTAKGTGVGKECLSQWYPAPFSIDGVTFATAEHYMMHQKALLFGDTAAAAQILTASDPGEAKALGRGVRDFDGATWNARRFDIVAAGNVAKFSQHAALGAFLRETGRKVLVEASPRDAIWGIGLGEKNEAARDPARWRGLNLLGFALMRARATLSAFP